jgi:hypothetical protein
MKNFSSVRSNRCATKTIVRGWMSGRCKRQRTVFDQAALARISLRDAVRRMASASSLAETQ